LQQRPQAVPQITPQLGQHGSCLGRDQPDDSLALLQDTSTMSLSL
jgi:hypothetical protein